MQKAAPLIISSESN